MTMKVLGTKVPKEIYDRFKEKTKTQGLNTSEFLRALILDSLEKEVKPSIQGYPEIIFILQEFLKVLYEVRKIAKTLFGYEASKLLEYVNEQISDFEEKLEFERKRK